MAPVQLLRVECGVQPGERRQLGRPLRGEEGAAEAQRGGGGTCTTQPRNGTVVPDECQCSCLCSCVNAVTALTAVSAEGSR